MDQKQLYSKLWAMRNNTMAILEGDGAIFKGILLDLDDPEADDHITCVVVLTDVCIYTERGWMRVAVKKNRPFKWTFNAENTSFSEVTATSNSVAHGHDAYYNIDFVLGGEKEASDYFTLLKSDRPL